MNGYVCVHVFMFAAPSVSKDHKSEAREVVRPLAGLWVAQAGLLTPGPWFLPPACTALPTGQIFHSFHAFLGRLWVFCSVPTCLVELERNPFGMSWAFSLRVPGFVQLFMINSCPVGRGPGGCWKTLPKMVVPAQAQHSSYNFNLKKGTVDVTGGAPGGAPIPGFMFPMWE